ncbi:MAG: NAD(+) diphosphatase [Bacteroidaceae bacterium]|nr:NAD(+) diphosphatase [Bacteroidaceae bacterium]
MPKYDRPTLLAHKDKRVESEMDYFAESHRYCGFCGGKMRQAAANSRICTSCGTEIWPRIQPAIITLVSRGEEMLLVHAHTLRHNVYGLVAGFVEVGENLEEAVEREIMEETGIRVKNLKYFASQSWPFPSNLMIGFTADYDSGELRLQPEEIADGGWFTKDNLPDIPSPDSIARKLIDSHLKKL